MLSELTFYTKNPSVHSVVSPSAPLTDQIGTEIFRTDIKSLLMAFLVVALMGCAPAPPQTASEAGINMSIMVMPDPPAVGETMLMITVTDEAGNPISDATLNVQGDMTHAGMVPVIRNDVSGANEGVYAVPFEWSMAGDWIVTVVAELADGREVEHLFDLSVESSGEMAEMDHSNGEKEGEAHDSHAEDKKDEGHNHDTESDDEAKEGEGLDQDGHGDASHEGDGHDNDSEHHSAEDKDGEMALDSEFIAAVEALDVKALHDLDVGVDDGNTIEADYGETVGHFQIAVAEIQWPQMYHEDVATLAETLTALKDALDADDLDAAQPLATEAHDQAHDLVNGIMEMSEEHDHGE